MCKLSASDIMLLLRRHHYIFLDSLSKNFSASVSPSNPVRHGDAGQQHGDARSAD
jgi:hypothetical protein